jgi:hypothetical protein
MPIWGKLESDSSIRILKILPGAKEDDVVCELYHASLDDESCIYDALSYTWGSLETPFEIICNGAKISITENLHSALSHIRSPSQDVHLWVDALCINQSREPDGLRERGKQVQMMWRIFSHARKMIAYLGDEFAGLQNAVALLQSFRHIRPDEFPNLPNGVDFVQELGKRHNLPTEIDERWHDFFRLSGSPYFRRVWVIQECVLARHLEFRIGPVVINGDFLQMAFLAYCRYLSETQFETGAHNWSEWNQNEDIEAALQAATLCMVMIYQLKVQWRNVDDRLTAPEHQEAAFVHQISYAQASLSSDPRDRIYGLLGLLPPESAMRIAVDYSESIGDLGCRMSLALLRAGCRAAIILYNCQGCRDNRVSWAYNANQAMKPYLNHQGALPIEGNPRLYSCCGETILKFEIDEHAHRLMVDGLILDSISRMTPSSAFTYSETPNSTFNDEEHVIPLMRWLSAIREWARSPEISAVLGASWSEKIWRTVIADTGHPYRARLTGLPDLSALEAALDAIRSGASAEQCLSQLESEEHQDKYLTTAVGLCERSCLGITERGLLALVPDDTRVGDYLAIILGGPVPFVLRPDGDAYRIVGACYVHNMMDGQALESDYWKPSILALV